jgi:predicted phosphoribosyltransferase
MFRDRTDAGGRLAAKLLPHRGRKDCQVLALSRGGLGVAHELARRLSLPLDLFLVRKLCAPGQRLACVGAVASGGIRAIDEVALEDAGLSEPSLLALERREREELRRQEAFFRDDREPLQLGGRTLILVDDGIASGASMLLSVACVRRREPRTVIVAAPVASRKACARLSMEADEVVCLETPEQYHGVAQWYENFAPVSSEQARSLLQQASLEV